jgi:hypothetical protein
MSQGKRPPKGYDLLFKDAGARGRLPAPFDGAEFHDACYPAFARWAALSEANGWLPQTPRRDLPPEAQAEYDLCLRDVLAAILAQMK